MYLTSIPRIIQWLMPSSLVWKIPVKEKVIFLTFDDGPVPEITPWVLKTLKDYKAKASFFCVGDNVRKHPRLFKQIQAGGHALGYHTFHHLQGRKTPLQDYLDDIALSKAYYKSRLFRPPHGRLSRAQIKALKPHYTIIMWTVLSGDFDHSITPEQCFKNTLKTGPGSIVVFHDSQKAEANLRYALPLFLEYYTREGYTFKAISSTDLPQRHKN